MCDVGLQRGAAAKIRTNENLNLASERNTIRCLGYLTSHVGEDSVEDLDRSK